MVKEIKIESDKNSDRVLGPLSFRSIFDDHWCADVIDANNSRYKLYCAGIKDDYYASLRLEFDFKQASRKLQDYTHEIFTANADSKIAIAAETIIYRQMGDDGSYGFGIYKEAFAEDPDVIKFNKTIDFIIGHAKELCGNPVIEEIEIYVGKQFSKAPHAT